MSSTRKLQAAAAAASFLLVSLLVLRVSAAAFTAQTDNPNNAWQAGAVNLTDSRGTGSAMFNVSAMVPGQTESRCINVTYSGTADPGAVKLFASSSGTLAQHLNVTVQEGSSPSGAYPSCTGFTSASTIVNSLALNTFSTDHANYGNGAGTWDPASGTHSRGYRVDVTLSASAPNSAQGTNAAATLTWETRTVAP